MASGHLLLTGGSDGIVRGFDLRCQAQVLMLPGVLGGVESLCSGPIAHAFTLGSGEGVLSVVELRKHQHPLHTFQHDTAAITNIRAWSEDAFWTTNSTGAAYLWKLPSSSAASASAASTAAPTIVAQLSGVDCEPIHDLCVTPMFTYLASYNAVRVYALGALPQKSATQRFHGLEIPQRRIAPAPAVSATTPTPAPASASA